MRVAVLGAGAAGLATAKSLCEVGLQPVVFEASDRLGGLWAYDETGECGGVAYRSLRTNTSKQVTAFSDTPFDDVLPDFPNRAAVETYLEQYAERWHLPCLVRFRHMVRSLQPAEASRWLLSVEHEGAARFEVFDAVVVCTGIFRLGWTPPALRIERFEGTILHSASYRVPEQFKERNALVVGVGSSAADIAADLVGIAGEVTMSVRRGAWVAPRFVADRPLDHRNTRLSLCLPAALRARRRHALIGGEWMRRGLPPTPDMWRRARVPFEPGAAPSVTSELLPAAVASGAIRLRPGIRSIAGRQVTFADGTSSYPDAIVLATGYALDFPFLPSDLVPWVDEATGLYRLVFSPGIPTLAFVGICRVHGPIFPIVEMQARWVAQVFSGAVPLPDEGVMRGEAAGRWRRQTARRDSPIRVALLPYLDKIAGLIGARPGLARHPRLAARLLSGPPVAARYRLEGPHSWAGAREVIEAAGGR